MTAHTVTGQPTPTTTAWSWTGSIARNFKSAVPISFTGIWYYSAPGCVLPTKCGLFDDTGTLVPGTLKTSPVWSGAAGSGWVRCVYDGSITIPANKKYQASVYINGTATFVGGGNNPIVNGCLGESQGCVDLAQVTDLTYSTTINGNDFLVDVEVTTPATFAGVSDDFNRIDGPLGANWKTGTIFDTHGPPTILSSRVVGVSGGDSTALWVANTPSDDQFSQITVPSLPTASFWVGPAVRMSEDAGSFYNVICWNLGTGSYAFQIFKRLGGGYSAIGPQVPWSATVGDVVKIEAFGNSIRVYLNGTAIIGVLDHDLSWGCPGITLTDVNSLDSWVAGSVVSDLNVTLTGTVGNVSTYSVKTPINVSGASAPQNTRVLTPNSPNHSYAHAFLWLLPVEPGQGSAFGDPIAQVQALGAQNNYNLTCIQPGFPIDPWYADNPSDSGTQQETFMLKMVEWAKANLAQTGVEVHYLIGFSKSGVGGQQLFFRHQDVFEAVASWDFPADQTFTQFGGSSGAVYGTQANFDSNYSLINTHLTAWKAEGDTGTTDKIWTGGFYSFGADVTDYDSRLTSLGIEHIYANVAASQHNWVAVPDWVGPAITFMAAVGPLPVVTGGMLAATGFI